jgi:hypothetical protein
VSKVLGADVSIRPTCLRSFLFPFIMLSLNFIIFIFCMVRFLKQDEK